MEKEQYYCEFCSHPFESELDLATVTCPKCNRNDDVDMYL